MESRQIPNPRSFVAVTPTGTRWRDPISPWSTTVAMRKKSRKRKKRSGGSNIFYLHPYLGKIPILTHIFSKGLKPQTSCSSRLCAKLDLTDFFKIVVVTKIDQRQIYSHECRATELQLMEALISSSSVCFLNVCFAESICWPICKQHWWHSYS